MKTNTILLLLLVITAISCSQSTSSDPTPTPTPTPADYSSCRYTFKYSLRYSPLSSAKPITLSYLDSTQKVRTVMLKDTSFELAVTYKYGDSVYVKASSTYMHFASKTGNKLFAQCTTTRANNASSCPNIGPTGSSTASVIPADSVNTILSAIPVRAQRITQ
ncbi:hypothetical protein [Spirosoma validum]|uniref:Uncharacterized protein n=1 Tax=Spirosoma validum TaxID=2771355 RepID=A0A927GD13_9BACT|nr:hypothetical protein [Spirosoma validum]MBD2753085.1 hypothetical protein [Spirosoma validum]